MSSTGTAQAVAVTCQLESMWYKVRRQHGDGDRADTVRGQWHSVWFLGRLDETPA